MTADAGWPQELKEYTESQWEGEIKTAHWIVVTPSGGRPFAFGTDLPCPDCKKVGFYGPRQAEAETRITRKYRACKFCGFWQEASGDVYDDKGGEPYRCNHFFCPNCQVYDWQVPWASEHMRCGKCGAEMKQIEWPTKNYNHPFNKTRDEIAQMLQR